MCKRGGASFEVTRQVGDSGNGRKTWETFVPIFDWTKKFLVASTHNIFRSSFQTAQKTSTLLYIYIFLTNILIYKHLDILYWHV
jgi:hypothetical protein